ncbi:MAG: DEAD/DEAH box helicase family protein [Alphaproteobacteria bacterium]|nr:DEAD/DEAH box helicase family protein [Alphaproteobacteria bacterium]
MAQNDDQPFYSHMLLNQWVYSLLGVDSLALAKKGEAPLEALADLKRRDGWLNGTDQHKYLALVSRDNTHYALKTPLYEHVTHSLDTYDSNIVKHTRTINEGSLHNPRGQGGIHWKYFQWLALLFSEIMLDLSFNQPDKMIDEFKKFVRKYNEDKQENIKFDVDSITAKTLSNIRFQCATGSGKTLLMHMNRLQFQHYANQQVAKRYNHTLLLTPNAGLSEQHLAEFRRSGVRNAKIIASHRDIRHDLLGNQDNIYIIEITKLLEDNKNGGSSNQKTKGFGNNNVIFVDEGHRGKDKGGAWQTARKAISEKGFVFEYSATFEQAIDGIKKVRQQKRLAAAHNILFDYSYRWFYNDGYGKDFEVLNYPKGKIDKSDHNDVLTSQPLQTYLIGCLLQLYLQMRTYDTETALARSLNIERPLALFVGTTVGTDKKTGTALSDTAKIIAFFAWFVHNENGDAARIVEEFVARSASLVGNDDKPVFGRLYPLLGRETLSHADVCKTIFYAEQQTQITLTTVRVAAGKDASGRVSASEIVMHCGNSKEPFGLIKVGDPKSVIDSLKSIDGYADMLHFGDSDFTTPQFASVKESSSPLNMMLGAKMFIEGWDCWRVSLIGLMNMGASEGTQVIQLFGRGVRLKGKDWSLKRAISRAGEGTPHGHEGNKEKEQAIVLLETLRVFGVNAKYLEKFQAQINKEIEPHYEGTFDLEITFPHAPQPNANNAHTPTPVSVPTPVDAALQLLQVSTRQDNTPYDFNRHGYCPSIQDVVTTQGMCAQFAIALDMTTTIGAATSSDHTAPSASHAIQPPSSETQHAILRGFADSRSLCEQIQADFNDKKMSNMAITPDAITALWSGTNIGGDKWYTLEVPDSHWRPRNYEELEKIRQIPLLLTRKFCKNIYAKSKRQFMTRRMEFVTLTLDHPNFPPAPTKYTFTVRAKDKAAFDRIKKKYDDEYNNYIVKRQTVPCTKNAESTNVWHSDQHLYLPLLFNYLKGKNEVETLQIDPAGTHLNEGEMRFVRDLNEWCNTKKNAGSRYYLLRNIARKGIGFADLGNFHPDFLFWILDANGNQFLTFIDPHGFMHRGQDSKLELATMLQGVPQSPNDPKLNAFMISTTPYSQEKFPEHTEDELLNKKHLLFFPKETMERGGLKESVDLEYIGKMIAKIVP